MVLTFFFFFDSNNLFIFVSSRQQIFSSIFVGKFILPRLQKYFGDILYTYLDSVGTTNLSSLSLMSSSFLLVASSLLWLLLSHCVRIPIYFLWGSCWDETFICTVFYDVNFFYPMWKKVVYSQKVKVSVLGRVG